MNIKTFLGVVGLIMVLVLGYYFTDKKTNIKKELPMEKKYNQIKIIPISHATAVIKWDDIVLYVDPIGDKKIFQEQLPPNIILVTDIHSDHFSTSTLTAISNGATLVVPQAVKELLPSSIYSNVSVLNNGESLIKDGIKIIAMPMYNLPESSNSFHVKERGNGYLLEKEGLIVYIAGDTAGIPEMRALKDVDIAFVPMNLPYTMGVEEAADAVLDFKPKKVYPYHYRGQGGFADINKFKELVNAGDSGIEVILADWYKE